jgi:hypothetical protein
VSGRRRIPPGAVIGLFVVGLFIIGFAIGRAPRTDPARGDSERAKAEAAAFTSPAAAWRS